MIRSLCTLLIYKSMLVESQPGFRCDANLGRVRQIQEGHLGDTDLFPWLGLLKVYVRDEGTRIIALTGIVFVTNTHALANADDIVKMPKWIFEKDTRAMFIPRQGMPRFYRLLSYIAHPEYLQPSRNTIALVRLDSSGRQFPKPICWPHRSYNNLNDLYTVGFTDDQKLLEKFIVNSKHYSLESCYKLYVKAGLGETSRVPAHYQCAYAANHADKCTWDTGMVLVTNCTGYWVLVGFGVFGPGCRTPTRYIDMVHYLPWIESVINPIQDTRRAGKFKGKGHDALQDWEYPFDTETHSIYFKIDRLGPNKIVIKNNHYGKDCEYPKERLIYHDNIRIETPMGFFQVVSRLATYRLSMFDLHFSDYACVYISVRFYDDMKEHYENHAFLTLNASIQETSYLYYETVVENKEASAVSDFGDTPRQLLQHYPMRNFTIRHPPPAVDPVNWKPGPHLRPVTVEEPLLEYNELNINVFLRFRFEEKANVDVTIYGPVVPRPTKYTPPSTTIKYSSTTSTTVTTSRTKPAKEDISSTTPEG